MKPGRSRYTIANKAMKNTLFLCVSNKDKYKGLRILYGMQKVSISVCLYILK